MPEAFMILLPVFIHRLVILLIIPGSNTVHPFFVFKIPINGFDDSDFKRSLRIPAEIRFDLARVDSISPVMPKSVLYMLYERFTDDLFTTQISLIG